jgi:single-strand DNA-binding protein
MNTGTFAGRLGRDAELRATPTGKDVMNFSLAVDIGFGDKRETLWVGCTMWGERGPKLVQYLTKGKQIAVSGDVGLRTYERKDGKGGAELTLNVQRLTLMGGGSEAAQKAASSPAPAAQEQDFDDDIPF